MLDHALAQIDLAVDKEAQRDEVRVPVVELVEASAGHDEGDALEGLLARRVDTLAHGQSQNSRSVIERLDELRVSRVRRQELDLEVEMRLRLGAGAKARQELVQQLITTRRGRDRDAHGPVVLCHFRLSVRHVDERCDVPCPEERGRRAQA